MWFRHCLQERVKPNSWNWELYDSCQESCLHTSPKREKRKIIHLNYIHIIFLRTQGSSQTWPHLYWAYADLRQIYYDTVLEVEIWLDKNLCFTESYWNESGLLVIKKASAQSLCEVLNLLSYVKFPCQNCEKLWSVGVKVRAGTCDWELKA